MKKAKYISQVLANDLWHLGENSLGKAYQQQAMEADAVTLQMGYPILDRAMRGIKPGEVVGIIARTAVGKTAFGANILRHMSKRGMVTLFFSLEMPKEQVFERFVQMEQELGGAEVEEMFKTDNSIANKVKADMGHRLPCIWVVDRPGLTAQDIMGAIELLEYGHGMKVRCVLIDYLGLVKPEEYAGGIYERTSTVALQMREIAKATKTGVIVLHQVSRAGKDGSEPVTLDMARDSGVVEEAVDHLIGLWLLKRGAVNRDGYRHVGLIKNRRGPCTQEMVSFNQKTLVIQEVSRGEELGRRITRKVGAACG